jgi:hypothetical protein
MDSQNLEQINDTGQNQNQPETVPVPSLPVIQEEDKEQNVKGKEYQLVVCDVFNNIEVKYPLKQGEQSIVGADSTCSVQIVNDPCVSSNHISITVNDDDIVVEDMGSKNGSFLMLNGPAQIQPGQSLLTGKTLLILEERVNAE